MKKKKKKIKVSKKKRRKKKKKNLLSLLWISGGGAAAGPGMAAALVAGLLAQTLQPLPEAVQAATQQLLQLETDPGLADVLLQVAADPGMRANGVALVRRGWRRRRRGGVHACARSRPAQLADHAARGAAVLSPLCCFPSMS